MHSALHQLSSVCYIPTDCLTSSPPETIKIMPLLICGVIALIRAQTIDILNMDLNVFSSQEVLTHASLDAFLCKIRRI